MKHILKLLTVLFNFFANNLNNKYLCLSLYLNENENIQIR